LQASEEFICQVSFFKKNKTDNTFYTFKLNLSWITTQETLNIKNKAELRNRTISYLSENLIIDEEEKSD